MIFLYLTPLIFLDSIQIKVFYESHAMNFKKELGKMRKSLSYLVAAATLSFGAPAAVSAIAGAVSTTCRRQPT